LDSTREQKLGEQSDALEKKRKALDLERERFEAELAQRKQALTADEQQLSSLRTQQEAKMREIRELEASVFQSEVKVKETERALRTQQDTLAQLQQETQDLRDQLIRDRSMFSTREQACVVF
jgi:chromosome segregation ATPase